jgi:hypothetical protein
MSLDRSPERLAEFMQINAHRASLADREGVSLGRHLLLDRVRLPHFVESSDYATLGADRTRLQRIVP